MLGRTFSYDFKVIGGKKLGRKLGSPTMNQNFTDGFVIPKYGVYISKAFVDGFWHSAVTNIGVCPTFGIDALRSETCISDFSGNLYGKHIEVGLIKFLRDEQKFASAEDLGKQMKIDIQKSKEYFTAMT